MVPVHPLDRPWLGMHLQGKIYIDGALPFGLCSTPKIFSALADGPLWIMLHNGMERPFHYLDDFLFLGPPGSDQCARSLQAALALCSCLVELVP